MKFSKYSVKSKYRFLLASSWTTNFKIDHFSIGIKHSLISTVENVSEIGKQMKDDKKCKLRGILLNHQSIPFSSKITGIPNYCSDSLLLSTLITSSHK